MASSRAHKKKEIIVENYFATQNETENLSGTMDGKINFSCAIACLEIANYSYRSVRREHATRKYTSPKRAARERDREKET